MKALKLLAIICLVFTFTNCSSVKLTEEAPFKVTGATYHSWVGGQPGVSGINVIIGVENDSEVVFKNIFFQKRKVNATIKTMNEKKYVTANINTSTRKEEVIGKEEVKKEAKPEEIPFVLESNEAVIVYQVGKKTYYYKVSKIKKTETIFYP
jgi:hypothetical protein